MKNWIQLTFLTMAFATSAFAQDKAVKPKMKATKDCGTCCTQGGDCCPRCSADKCAACCDKKKEAPKQ